MEVLTAAERHRVNSFPSILASSPHRWEFSSTFALASLGYPGPRRIRFSGKRYKAGPDEEG